MGNQIEILERVKQVLLKNPVIVLIGQSGSGKGTQAGLIQKTVRSLGFKNGLFHIETGDLFRKEIPRFGDFFSKKIAETQNAGKLQSPLYASFLWQQKMLYEYSSGPILIDGSPRSVSEAQMMIDFFHYTLDREMIIFNFIISDEIATQRIQQRNTLLEKPREDTNSLEKIKEKLKFFKTNVIPAVDFLNVKPGSAVYSIDACENIDSIHRQIVTILATFS